jgi:hypothetical protein
MAYLEARVRGHANHVLARREREEADARLAARIGSMRPSIDAGRKHAAEAAAHKRRYAAQLAASAAVAREARFGEIERENARLLGRMHAILTAPARADVGGQRPWSAAPARLAGAAAATGPGPGATLNHTARRAEAQRITDENLRLLRRIQDARPSRVLRELRGAAAEQEALLRHTSQFATGRRGDGSVPWEPLHRQRPASAAAVAAAGAGSHRPAWRSEAVGELECDHDGAVTDATVADTTGTCTAAAAPEMSSSWAAPSSSLDAQLLQPVPGAGASDAAGAASLAPVALPPAAAALSPAAGAGALIFPGFGSGAFSAPQLQHSHSLHHQHEYLKQQHLQLQHQPFTTPTLAGGGGTPVWPGLGLLASPGGATATGTTPFLASGGGTVTTPSTSATTTTTAAVGGSGGAGSSPYRRSLEDLPAASSLRAFLSKLNETVASGSAQATLSLASPAAPEAAQNPGNDGMLRIALPPASQPHSLTA